jgi:hypothetical protein
VDDEGDTVTGLNIIGTALEQCYDAIESLTGRMDATQWHAQSLCPDWDTRGVVAHLGMMERVMSGWLPESAGDPPPLDRIGPYHDEMAALDDAAFAARISDIFASRRADLAGPTWPGRPGRADRDRPGEAVLDASRAAQLRGVPGDPDLRFLGARARYQHATWVPSNDAGPCTEIALGQVEASIGYIVARNLRFTI